MLPYDIPYICVTLSTVHLFLSHGVVFKFPPPHSVFKITGLSMQTQDLISVY
jgi:hypothetical protein